ncbi:MAG: hypothetical protein AB7H88_09010 [Vicinamibacterales bacterium]
MMHLTPDEFVDAVEGALAPERQEHLDACHACREETARLAAILREASSADVPEPSPLFWDHFSARVSAAVEAEAAPSSGWLPAWCRLPVLAPVASLALVVMALAVALPAPTPSPSSLAATAGDPLPFDEALADDGSWQLVTGVVATVDWDTVREAGLVPGPAAMDRAVAALSESEQAELVRLLRAEINRPPS